MAVMVDGIIELLRKYIDVPVIIRNAQVDRTPCVTVNQASNTQLERTFFHNPYEVIRYKYACDVWIDIWCDTEDERESLVERVNCIFNQAIANDYHQCANYMEGECSYLEDTCQAKTVFNGNTAKNQCPYPVENHYTSFFKKNHIIKNTFTLDGEIELDERNIKAPVLRTQLKAHMEYYTYYNTGGILFNDIKVNL